MKFIQGDGICAGLCCVSVDREMVSGVLVWCSVTGKIKTISALKAVSMGCQRFRDLCAADPTCPLY